MKGTSRVIMGATLVMVVSLAVVLGLIIVLLAELYCSLLIRRRHLRKNNTTNTAATTTTTTPFSSQHSSSPPPLPPFNNNIYSQGVLQPPRTFVFPSIACMEDPNANPNPNLNANASPRRIGLVSVPSPLASFIARAPPMQVHQEEPLQLGNTSASETLSCPDPNKNSYCVEEKHPLVYISNPIYENEEGKASDTRTINTPFETPDTSPSRLEGSVDGSPSSSDGDDAIAVSLPLPYTPPLTPMKKLPTEACSVSLRDAKSLGTSASDSRSNNEISSSSSSVSPRTSPSW